MMAQAYDEKAGNYGNIKGVGAASVGIAAVELIAAQMGFPICSPTGSGAALVGGGLMMAMAGSLQGTSKEAAASHKDKAGRLQSLVNKWDIFHKNNTQNEEDSRLAGGGGGASSVTTIGGNGSITSSGGKTSGSQTIVQSNSLSKSDTISSKTKRENSCIGGDGKANSSCSCLKNNSCVQRKPPQITLVGTKKQKSALSKSLNKANTKLGVGKLIRNFNSMARGRQTLYDWSKRNKKLTNQRVKYASNILKKYNSLREKKGFTPINFDKNFIAKHAKTNAASAVDFSTSEKEIREENSLSKNLVKNITRYKKQGSWKNPLIFDKGIMYEEEVKEDLAAKNTLVDGKFVSSSQKTNIAASKKLDDRNLISRDQSLFGAISRRYLKKAKAQEWIFEEN
jgi:hypothetical protein